MAELLTTNEQYLAAKRLVEVCTTTIGNAYSLITSLSNDKEITQMQNFIDSISNVKLGYWGLITIYEKGLKPLEEEEKYYVQQGVTLPEIAIAFYGKQELWQYIYYYNQLTTDILTVGQELIIPNVGNLPETVLHQAEIFSADLTNFYGILEGRITGN